MLSAKHGVLLGYARCFLVASFCFLLITNATDGGTSADTAITFTVFHRSSGAGEGGSVHLLSRRLGGRPATDSTSSGAKASSSRPGRMQFRLVTLDEAFGEYFAVLQIGTPAQLAAVAIDTGSQLLWVQCQPCLQCGTQSREYPIFNPSESSSYAAVTCDECRGDDSVATICSSRHMQGDKCIYAVTYGDRSNSSGYLSTETLSINTPQGPSNALQNIIFGCGLINTGLVSTLNASGLLGLDRGRFSLISQLNIRVFSYCLPNRVKNVHSSGYLTLGTSAPSTTNGAQLQYTHLLQNKASEFLSQFYYLNMTGISVNGQLLSIPPSAFQLLPSGQGGTIIDSGTSITSFVHTAYAAFSHAFDSAVDSSLKRIDLGDDSPHLCYQVPLWQHQAPVAPKVTLHLAGPVDLHLQAHHVLAFLGSDSSSNYYCMAFMDSGYGPTATNFIGNYQQQDFLVEYDVANSRIGFAPTKCSLGITLQLWSSYTQILWVIIQVIFISSLVF